MSGRGNTDALIASRKLDSSQKRQRVLDAIEEIVAAGAPLTFGRVAATAGVSEGLVHAPELKAAILEARTRTVQPAAPPSSPSAGPGPSPDSLLADTEVVRDHNRRLQAEIASLRDRLRLRLGEESDPDRERTAQRLAEADARAQRLSQENTELTRTVTELRRELGEREDELASLRTAHSRLMKRVN